MDKRWCRKYKKKKLVKSILRHLKAVVDAKGYPTKYSNLTIKHLLFLKKKKKKKLDYKAAYPKSNCFDFENWGLYSDFAVNI